MQNKHILIADIGGTNARFALATKEAPFFIQAQTYQCADFDNIEQAITTYLDSHNITDLQQVCFAVAGPIVNDTVKFTNNHWQIDAQVLREKYHCPKVQLLNDFQAIAYSLPKLQEQDVMVVGKQAIQKERSTFTYGAVGPGSGLGVAGLMKVDANTMPIISEGGHVGFSPESKTQIEIHDYLMRKFNRVSIERLLSGPGLMNIHEALCDIHGVENPGLSASEITAAGTQGDKKICQLTVDVYFEILGQVAGDVALMFNARDGIFIAGGIIQRYPDYLQKSKFRDGFENKGRHQALMQQVPTVMIKRKNPGLVGCSSFCLDYA